MGRKEVIDNFIHDKEYAPMKFKDIGAILGVPENEMLELGKYLDELVYEGRIIKEKNGQYVPVDSDEFISGKFSMNKKGFGFLRPDDGTIDDVFIAPENTGSAMNNDNVLVKIIKKSKNASDEGKIVKITSRNNRSIVGTVQLNKRCCFLIPDDKNLGSDIFITKTDGVIKNGIKAVAKITKWPEKGKCAEGVIYEVLGFPGEKGVDVMSVIHRYKIRENFKPDVVAEAEKMSKTPLLLKGRNDLRHLKTITIDSSDAKDLDDAISLTKNNSGFTLGVHIADVSEYVKENSNLDKEAFNRGTSVYFADRVIPMLPKALSNGACSLNEKEDKLALSVIMQIDFNGNVNDYTITESVINSDHRMTYTDVTDILNGNKELTEKYSNIKDMLFEMKELAEILNKKRVKRGSILFDFPESKAVLDDNGKAVDIVLREYTISNSIIEEFMLVCNETVAEHGFWNELPFIYRIHEKPDENKMEKLKKFMGLLGYSFKNSKEIHSSQFNKIIEEIKGKEEEKVLSVFMLRSLMKARYSPDCDGHFGLGAKYYCHFTSPIRRYPDLMVHRILKKELKGELNLKEIEKLSGYVAEASVKSSDCEIIAQDAERDIMDMKKAEYAEGHIGKVCDGIISSITSFGIFVEYENTVEGLVRYADIRGDYFEFDADTLSATGVHSGKTYKIGDKVKTMIVNAFPETGEIDMIFV